MLFRSVETERDRERERERERESEDSLAAQCCVCTHKPLNPGELEAGVAPQRLGGRAADQDTERGEEGGKHTQTGRTYLK